MSWVLVMKTHSKWLKPNIKSCTSNSNCILGQELVLKNDLAIRQWNYKKHIINNMAKALLFYRGIFSYNLILRDRFALIPEKKFCIVLWVGLYIVEFLLRAQVGEQSSRSVGVEDKCNQLGTGEMAGHGRTAAAGERSVTHTASLQFLTFSGGSVGVRERHAFPAFPLGE